MKTRHHAGKELDLCIIPRKRHEGDIVVTTPERHPHPWVNLPFHYVQAVLWELERTGHVIDRAWLDPSDPRDATIVFTNLQALTWDESRGWLAGDYVGGEQGVRTVLADARQLVRKILPSSAEVATAVVRDLGTDPVQLRAYGTRDGLDEQLRAFAL